MGIKNLAGKKFVLFALLFGGAAVSTRAQEASRPAAAESPAVEGQVFDHNGGGIANVEVSLRPKEVPKDAKPIASVQTNQFGDFRIFHDPPLSGAYVLVFKKRGYTPVQREIDIVPGEEPPFVDLSLPGNLSVTGVVIDQLKNTPVAAAQVVVNVAGQDFNATTNRQGTFHIEHLTPGGLEVTVDAKGFARARVELANMSTSQPLRIELRPERVVKLETVDEQGNPVSGVTVECMDDKLGDYHVVVSDAKGLAVLGGLDFETTELSIRLTHPAFVGDAEFDRKVVLPADASLSHHRLTLVRAGSIVGKIVDAGTQQPLQGVRVSVSDDAHQNDLRDWTGFDGSYDVSAVPPGDRVVTAYLNGYAPQLKPTTVKPKEKSTVDFAMGPAKQAAGLVVDQQGNPVPGVYLYATSWRGHSTLGAQALTGDDGRFVLDNLPDDPIVEVSIEAAGFERLVRQRIAPGKMDHRFELVAKSAAPNTPSKLKIGEPFPQLDMVTLDGKPLKMADLKGQTVLVDFWATWCGPCVAEIPNLIAVQKALGSRQDFKIISITLDADQDEKKLRRFIGKKKMNWTHVFGKKGHADRAAERCGVEYIPQTFLVGPDGVLQATDLSGPSMVNDITSLLEHHAKPKPKP